MLKSAKTIRVHLDTEFTDFVEAELISIGFAASNGEEFYGENVNFNDGRCSPFVKEVVFPLLDLHKYGMSNAELAARIWTWFDELDADFVILAAGHQIDFDLFFDLMAQERHPKILATDLKFTTVNRWINGNIENDPNPEDSARAIYISIRRKLFELTMEYFLKNNEKQHHALSDARADRYAWNILITEFGIPN